MTGAALQRTVRRAVRFRFALTEDMFIEMLTERARMRAPERDPADYASSLCLDDLYLAVACAHGDERAWQECRDRYFAYIRQFAHRFVDDAAAHDVADQLIADLWQRSRFLQYDGRSTLRTWLGAMVAHAAINAGKAVSRSRQVDVRVLERTPERSAAGPRENGDTRRVLAAIVQRALTALHAEARLLLLLYYEQGLSLDQMTKVLNASKATLSRRLERVREELRRQIDRMTRDELQLSSDALRAGLDLARLEIDLPAALGNITLERQGSERV